MMNEVAKKLSLFNTELTAMTTDTQANKMVNARHGLSQSSRVIYPSNEMGNAQMKNLFL